MRRTLSIFLFVLSLLAITPDPTLAQLGLPGFGGSSSTNTAPEGTTEIDAASSGSQEQTERPQASQDVTNPNPASLPPPRDVRGEIAAMPDEEVRRRLTEEMEQEERERRMAMATEPTTATELFERILAGTYQPALQAVERLPILVSSQLRAFHTFGETLGSDGLLELVVLFGVAIAAGLGAEYGFNRFMRWRFGARNLGGMASLPGSLKGRLRFLFIRLVQETAGVLVFFIVARICAGFLITKEIAPFVGLITLYLIVIPRLGIAFIRFLLAPNRPEFRIVHTDDWTARFLVRHQTGVLLLLGFTMGIIQFNAMNGLMVGETRLGFWLNLALHLYLIFVCIRTRKGLELMMRGADPNVTPTEKWVSQIYPNFCIAVIVGTWLLVNIVVSFGLFDLLAGAPHYWTMTLLLFAPMFDTMIRGLVNALVPPMQGTGLLAETAYFATKRSYIRVGRTITFAAIVLVIASLWNIDLNDLASNNIGASLAASLLEALLTLAVGYLLWELVSLWINQKLAAEQTVEGDEHETEAASEGEGGQGGSRLSTILPLALLTARVTIVALVGLVALSALGIDTTPLLAGAGVVGLAVGFGAQKLVGDVVSGVFFLVDDAFRVGEYVEVDGTMGTVEKISIRSMQLRHHLGPVHTIPYGEIPKLTNYSRDWVIMKLVFTVPFNTDPNKVKKIFKRIGQEMAAQDEFKNDFLQPFKSQGVLDFDDRGMIVRGKFMAKPGTQFTIRKEIFNRVKAAFADAGIEFARREVQVAIPGLEQASLTEEQKKAVGAAAAEAAQQTIEAEAPASGTAASDQR